MELQVGSIYEGKVTGITKFGAFVSLPGGKSGMVHISEVANAYVEDIHNYLTEGQTVTVKLIGIDQMNRINLSVKKAAAEQPSHAAPPPPPVRSTLTKSEDSSFEDKLRQFMQTSESKMSDLRAGADKRGGRRRGGR